MGSGPVCVAAALCPHLVRRLTDNRRYGIKLTGCRVMGFCYPYVRVRLSAEQGKKKGGPVIRSPWGYATRAC